MRAASRDDMEMGRQLSSRGPRRWLRRVGFLSAIAFPALVTAALLPFRGDFANSTVAAMSYLLAVLAASLVGGLVEGLVASVIAFLGLNLFFTPPFHTFAVDKSEDLFALFVFLVVSTVVANLFTQLLRQRERATRREGESGLLYRMASRLLGRSEMDLVLHDFAHELSELLELDGCEIHLAEDEGAMVRKVRTGSELESAEDVTEIPMRTDRESFGVVRMWRGDGRALDAENAALAKAVVAQLALAMESLKLQEKAALSQADAETNRARAALFSAVTHDLRTPLASIKASATSLLEEGVRFEEPQRVDLLRTIAEESDRLNRLIGNLLHLSRVRAGALVPQKVPTLIDDVVDSVVARLRGFLGEQQVEIRVKDGIPAVPMDVMQIDQVLTNLVENAARYAPPGTPIEIGLAKWHSHVEVKVVDRGRGIPAEQRERVFDEFFRGEGSDQREGAGLGLSIARAIIQAHGGTISVHDTPGGGTTVRFRLPIGPASNA